MNNLCKMLFMNHTQYISKRNKKILEEITSQKTKLREKTQL